MSDREPGVSIWLPSYWISQQGVEEANLILCTAWPHKHPENTGSKYRKINVNDYFVNYALGKDLSN